MNDSWEVSVKWSGGEPAEAGGRRAAGRLGDGTACSVTTYNVPKNKSGCRFVNTKVGQSWEMEVDFGGTCGNCEYRQYVKGFFKLNGMELSHALPGASNPPTYQPCRSLSRGSSYEDGVCPYPGYGPHFGHRAQIGAADDIYQNPNRATGSEYRGSDFPGMGGLVTGDQYEIDLTFTGHAINTAEGTTLRSSTWTVQCSGTVA